MSTPIKYCFLVEAADKQEWFAKLHPIMKANIAGGHYSIWPCDHDPPCRQLSDEECADLMTRFNEPVSGAHEASRRIAGTT